MENGTVGGGGDKRTGLPNQESSQEKYGARSGSAGGHKRSVSGSILAKLPFLRSSFEEHETGDETIPSSNGVHADGGHLRDEENRKTNQTTSQQPKKARRRKGSLRKTAILGTGKMRAEGREQRPSTLMSVDTNYPDPQDHQVDPSEDGSLDGHQSKSAGTGMKLKSFKFPTQVTHVKPLYANDPLAPRADPRKRVASDEGDLLSRSPPLGEGSTTDEEDHLTMAQQPASALHHGHILKKSPSSESESYFPPLIDSSVRRRSVNRPTSPLSALPISPSTSSDEWDYTETAWWGWAILIVTWIVFVVGMGSCLEVWSWAWDVGETPYAPPELEDDPTLPIVGYYPALIILTSVMAWVWVVVAWMGMKYFKHAKISGDDF